MALQSQRTLYLVLSLVVGGLIGAALGVEDRIYAFGEWLKARFHVAENGPDTPASHDRHGFAEGFLVASVLFCVGALTIIGAFQAGVERVLQPAYSPNR